MILSVTMKKWLRLKRIPNLRLECKSHTLFETKMVKIDILLMTKKAENHTLRGCTYLYSANMGETPRIFN